MTTARRIQVLFAAATIMLVSAIAAGQSSPAAANPPSTTAAPTTAPPAATSAAPESAAFTEARERQRRGRGLIDSRDFNGALAEFQRVYDLLVGHPRRYMALSNIGRAYQGLGQYDRAMEFYQRYLDEGPADAEDRAQVVAAVHALDDLLATIVTTVTGPATAEVWVDNHRSGDAPGRLRVSGGRHSVEVRAAGFVPARREVQLSAHDTTTLAFVMDAAGSGVSRTVFRVGAGLTVVSLLVAGGFGLAAMAARADVDRRLANPMERFTVTDDDQSQINRLGVIGDACLIAAGAIAVGTVVLYFITNRSAHPAENHPAVARRTSVVPYAGASAFGAVLQGSF